MEIILDEAWKEVLNILRGYGIAEVSLEGDGETITLEELDESHVALVKSDLHGPTEEGAKINELGVNAEKLFWILKEYGTPCRAEVKSEDGEISVTSSNDQDCVQTLSIVEPSQEGSVDLNIERSVEAKGVNLHMPLRTAKRIHGLDRFYSSLAAEDGKLLFEYWTEDSTDGARSMLGEANDDTGSATYNPKLLMPLKGEWDIGFAPDMPLVAEKAIEGEEGWRAGVTVVIAPRVESVG